MSSEAKILSICVIAAGAIAGTIFVDKALQRGHEARQAEENRKLELEKTEIKKTYPDEYWKAKEAEARANAEIEKARIESEERLKKDERDRRDAEKEAQRIFEQNAPAEYWRQKRTEEEEKTKREAERLRYEAERDVAKRHSDAITESAKAIERAAKKSFGYSTYNW